MNAFPAVEFDVTTASEAGALIYWQRKEEQSLEVREDSEFRWLLLDGVGTSGPSLPSPRATTSTNGASAIIIALPTM